MTILSILVGKIVKAPSKLRGSGSAFPGLVVEKLQPSFLQKMLSKLPYGVVVILGTNGKTTTTKTVSELLQKQGLRVFTNKTGSNFVRGVISEILDVVPLSGRFDYDIAVLDLDAAHAVRFAQSTFLDYALILNIQRDQLDRFGEIDHTAELLQSVAFKARKCVVLNAEDSRVSKITGKKCVYFGLSDNMKEYFPNDDNLICGHINPLSDERECKVVLKNLEGQSSTYTIGGKDYTVNLSLKGRYNAFNVAAALTLVKEILPDADLKSLLEGLSGIGSAFGRGEVFSLEGHETELFLVKNPSAFQLSLDSFVDANHDYMIAINDLGADGHDVSWLWNVDFSALKDVAVTSGIRSDDMALRLKYDNVAVGQSIPDIPEALKVFSKAGDNPKRIFATYTAMLEIRKTVIGRSIL